MVAISYAESATTLSELTESGNAAIERLRAISALPAGWDGDDSPPLQPAACIVAAKIAERLDNELPAPHIAPVRGGGVQFEWDYLGAYLEIEISANGQILFLLQTKSFTTDGQLDAPEFTGPLIQWLKP